MYMNWDNANDFLNLSLYIFILNIYVTSPISFIEKILDNYIFNN